MKLRLLRDMRVRRGMRVLVRVDLDVAAKGKKIKDDFRIQELAPTLRYLLKKDVALRLMAHWKRPGGQMVPELSLQSFVHPLERLLGTKVYFIRNPQDPSLFKKYGSASSVLLFENLRFWRGEEHNSRIFAKNLSRWGDGYVNEAFANAHRKHASMVGVPAFLPSYAGLHLAEEVKQLNLILTKPRRPVVALLGGAKIETKLPLIERFIMKNVRVLLGGALANTVFALQGMRVGKSRVDVLNQDTRKRLVALLQRPSLFFLPIDVRVAASSLRSVRVTAPDGVGERESIWDVGPRTTDLFTSILRKGRTIIWNGPLGRVEERRFAHGTLAVARALRTMSAFKVVGGGDSVAFLRSRGLLRGFNHISTGGGAMLEFLSGKKLSALEALESR